MVVVGDKIQSKNFFAIYKFSLPSFVEKKMQKMGVGWVVVVVGVWVGCWWGVVFSNRKYFDKFMIINWGIGGLWLLIGELGETSQANFYYY